MLLFAGRSELVDEAASFASASPSTCGGFKVTGGTNEDNGIALFVFRHQLRSCRYRVRPRRLLLAVVVVVARRRWEEANMSPRLLQRAKSSDLLDIERW